VEHMVNSGGISVYTGVVRLVIDCWEKNVSEESSETKVLDPWAHIRLYGLVPLPSLSMRAFVGSVRNIECTVIMHILSKMVNTTCNAVIV
jgi:hypothetical protein